MFRARTAVVIVFLTLAVIASSYVANQFLSPSYTPLRTIRHSNKVAALGAPPAGMTNAQETPNEELAKVSAAWRRREVQTQGLYCKWKCATVWPAGPIGYPRNGEIAKLPEDTTISETLECTFTGNSLRFSQSGPKWNDKAAQFIPRLQLIIANNEANLIFTGRAGMGGNSYPSASYYAPGRNILSDHFHLTALFLIFRPFNSRFGEELHLASIEPVKLDAANQD